MTVPVPGSLTYTYVEDGVTTVFSYPVRFLEATELTVIREDADGLRSTLVYNTDYTVSGAGNPLGGSITRTAVTNGGKIIITRSTSPKQLVDLKDGQRNPAEAVELQLDRLAMVDQDQQSGIDRAWKAIPGEDGQILPSPAEGQVIGWKDGQAANIKIGSAALADTSEFATVEQGEAADSAVQPGDPEALPTDGSLGQVLLRDPDAPAGRKWSSTVPTGGGDMLSTAYDPEATGAPVAFADGTSRPYASRAAAVAAYPAALATAIKVISPSGRVLDYVQDSSGTALETADGRKWSPAGTPTLDHFSGWDQFRDYVVGKTGSVIGSYSFDTSSIKSGSAIIGAGPGITTLTRTGISTFFSATLQDRWFLSDLTLDLDRSNHDFGGHGIRLDGCKDWSIDNVEVRDFGVSTTGQGGGTGILVAAENGPTERGRLSNFNLFPNGGGIAEVGWLIADGRYNFVSRGYSADADIGIGYAHELKNDARYNVLTDLIGVDSCVSLAYGHETEGVDGADANVAHGILGIRTDCGWNVGEGELNLTSGLIHIATDSPNTRVNGKVTVQFSSSASRNVAADVISVGDVKDVADFRGNGNYARVYAHDDATGSLGRFQGSMSRNVLEIAHPGTRNTILGTLTYEGTEILAGPSANIAHSPATGERFGSLSGRFHDRLGNSGVDHSASGLNFYRWRYETSGNAYLGFFSPGANNTRVGIGAVVPTDGSVGEFLYNFGSTRANDTWTMRIGGSPVATFSTSTFSFSRPVQLVSQSVNNLPSASPAGQMIYVQNESGGAIPAFSDGTNWRRMSDRAIVS